jgi:transcriptional regulator with XRE-family HTH domain
MASKKPGRPTIAVEEAGRVQKLIKRLFVERYEGNQSAFARDLGIEQPSFRALLKGTSNPSRPTMKRLAQIVGVERYEDILSGAKEIEIEPLDTRFPSKSKAAIAAENVDLPPEAIRLMLDDAAPELHHDPGAHYWLKRVEAFALGMKTRDPRGRGND